MRTLAQFDRFPRARTKLGRWPRCRTTFAFKDVFLTPAGKRNTRSSTKDMQAKIGQKALEIDFLAGALGRIGDAGEKR